MDWKRILINSTFSLPLNATDGGGANSSSGLSVWGSGNYKNPSKQGGDTRWKGDVFGLQLGMDKRVRDDLLVGGMVSYSKCDIDYTQTADKGKYTHKMTNIHPYLAWSDGEASL